MRRCITAIFGILGLALVGAGCSIMPTTGPEIGEIYRGGDTDDPATPNMNERRAPGASRRWGRVAYSPPPRTSYSSIRSKSQLISSDGVDAILGGRTLRRSVS